MRTLIFVMQTLAAHHSERAFASAQRSLVCALVSLSATACSSLLGSSSETLYSYREVGLCRDGYVGESHTPGTRIKECLGLLTTSVTLRVSAESQAVTFVEEDRGFNKDFEIEALSVSRLKDCKIVDKLNFACQGLVRTDGAFISTDAFGGRKLSSSWVSSKFASFSGGWVGVGILDFHESAWSTAAYVAGPLVGLLVLIGFAS